MNHQSERQISEHSPSAGFVPLVFKFVEGLFCVVLF